MSRHAPHEYTPAHSPSSRAAYPAFLSLHETLWLQTKCFLRGLFDASRWDQVVWTATRYTLLSPFACSRVHNVHAHSDPEIRSNILKSLLLNSLSLASIYTFDLLLQPLVHGHPNWLRRNVGWFYQILWLIPVVSVSFYLNVSTVRLFPNTMVDLGRVCRARGAH